MTGEPIVAIATGLNGGSLNVKTGPMVQTWIIRADVAPMDAKRENLDVAVCGDCRHRGDRGYGSSCYVTPWLGPNNVFKKLGEYPTASWSDLQALLVGKDIRLGAYGDPAALPFEVWRAVLKTAHGWTGYSHQWKRCDERLKAFLMASVDTPEEMQEAQLRGWRTFRVRGRGEPLLGGEVMCPASDEAGHRATCQTCELCRGQSNPAKSVAIIAHGTAGNLAAFYRNRDEATA